VRYKDLLQTQLLEWADRYEQVRDTRATQHLEMVEPSHEFFHSILALDVIYNDLDPEVRAKIISGMDNMARWFAQQGNSWPLNKHAVLATWAFFIGDRERFLAEKALYDYYLFDVQLTPGGVYSPGSGYAYFRLARENPTKMYFMDIVEFTGEGNYYDDPRLISFYEWVFSGAITPSRTTTTFGRTSSNGLTNRSVVAAVRAARFSELAAQYAAWAVQGSMPSHTATNAAMTRAERLALLAVDPAAFSALPPRGQFLDYVVIDDLLAVPKKPTSRIWDAYASFWEDNPSGDSLMAALWSTPISDPGAHKDTNAIHIHGFGQPLLRNVGYLGWNQGYGDFPWEYFNLTAVSSNVVLIDDTDHRLKQGKGIVEGFTGQTLDYALADSGQALPNGVHLRNLLFVHPQDERMGYFVLLDEVKTNQPGANVNLVLHPQSDQYEETIPSEAYHFPIKYTDNVYLSIHLGSEPADVDMRDGVLEHSVRTFIGKYLYATFKSDDTGRAHFATVLLPHKADSATPLMSRLNGPGFSGVELMWDDVSKDIVLTPEGSDAVRYEGVEMQGLESLYRICDGELAFYFTRQATALHYVSDRGGVGFRSDVPITVHNRGDKGQVVSSGAKVTFYVPNSTTGVLVDSKPAQVVEQGSGWITVQLEPGSFDFEFMHE
jgi:hypothetical protein